MTSLVSRRVVLQRGALLLAPSLAPPAFAQAAYPTKPVLLIVPQPAGGDADAVCRALQPVLQQALGQTVVIDNRGGAGGNIGTALGAKAAPDGYTVTFVNQGTMAVNPTLYPNPGYKLDELMPVTWLTTTDLVIVANPAVPASNLKEFLALARKEPGKLTYGTAGNGSANHLAGEMLKSMAKVDITHVPYKGGGPALIGLLGGEINAAVAFPMAALPHIRSGKLKAIAVTGEMASFRKTADSGREIDIFRCTACGARLWHRPVSYPQLSFVCTGTLDDVSWVVPTSHIWVASGTPTDTVTPDAIHFDGPAPDRQLLWDHFAKLYPA